MSPRSRPTEEDRRATIGIALSGVSRGDELAEIAARLGPLHPRNDTFPGEVLLELAADAIELSGASRGDPIELEGVLERFLPEAAAHTKAERHKSEFALRAAAMPRGGVDPGLLDEVSRWRTDDLWYWSLEALVTYVRAAADRTGQSIVVFCGRLAERHHVTLDE